MSCHSSTAFRSTPCQAGTKPPETGTNTTNTNTKEPKTVVIGGKENTTVEYKTAPIRAACRRNLQDLRLLP
ncbi:MAG: hypothetical protein R2688_07250 [Fimbriimonadaceae bacterium]